MDKLWNEPWSPDDLVSNAANWSLAGDAGLLKFLEQFSDDLLERADETSENLDRLFNSLDETSLSLDMVNNDLLSLQSTQFIESRVYEEDETLVNEKEAERVQKPIGEAEMMEATKEAVLKGISMVEKYFDKVEVGASDSEDDADFPSFVLLPKDPYLTRPLPYVIGTQVWHSKWHVGLLESSSESEGENPAENVSDSESDLDQATTPRNNANYSNSGSEFDSESITDKPSLGSANKGLSNHDSEYDEQLSHSASSQVSANNFAAVLAAKLGNVAKTAEANESHVNTKPIRKPEKTYAGNLFFDEPPPLDDDEDDDGDDLFGDIGQKGLFSAGGDVGGGLFDDLDDSGDFWGGAAKGSASDAAKDHSSNHTTKETKTNHLASSNLFNENDDSEDDDLFSTKRSDAEKSSYLSAPTNRAQPLIDDEPPSPLAQKKKPVGGVSVMGGANLFGDKKFGDILKSRRRDSSASDSSKHSTPNAPVTRKELEPKKEQVSQPEPTKHVKVTPKTTSLFDDDDGNLFDDDLFSNINSTKLTSHLFADESFDDDLFASVERKPKVSEAIGGNEEPVKIEPATPPACADSDWDIADHREQPLDDDSLFGADIYGGKSSLFDDEPPSLFADSDAISPHSTNDAQTSSGENPASAPSSAAPTSELTSSPQQSDDLLAASKSSAPLAERSLHDQSVNDEAPIDIQFAAHEDVKHETNASKMATIGKLRHNLNINVNALLPGGAPARKRIDADHLDAAPNLSHSHSVDEIIGQPRAALGTVEKSTSFDAQPEILHSVTKDRPRIQVKRRPSTRKGRQETLRRSAVDLPFDFASEKRRDDKQLPPITPATTTTANPIDHSLDDNDDSNLMTDVDDFVHIPDIPLDSEADEITHEDDDDIFPTSTPSNLNAIFDDDDADDLFANITEKGASFDDLFGPPAIDNAPTLEIGAGIDYDVMAEEPNVVDDLDRTTDQASFDDLFGASPIVSASSGAMVAEIEKNLMVEEPNVVDDFDSTTDRASFDDLFGAQEIVNASPNAIRDNVMVEARNEVGNIDGSEVNEVVDKIEGGMARQSKAMANDIFDDDDEDDLFSSKPIQKGGVIKKSLFNDDLDDDDDIFGPTASTSNIPGVKSEVRRPKSSKTPVKKVLNSEIVDDPLSAFK